MKSSSNNISKSLGVILGTPILLLIVSFFLIGPSEEPVLIAEANNYFSNLPEAYRPTVDTHLNNRISESYTLTEKDSFVVLFDEKGFERELVIIRTSPSKTELSNNFNIKLFPKSNSNSTGVSEPLEMTLSTDASIYKYRNSEHAVFKTKLPFIAIDSIKIVQILRNKRLKQWSSSIRPEFSEVKVETPGLSDGGIKKPVNALSPLLNHALIESGIQNDFKGYTIVSDSIFETYQNRFNTTTSSDQSILKIENPNKFWATLNIKGEDVGNLIEIKGKDADKAENLLKELQARTVDFQAVFNQDKLTSYFVLLNLFTSRCFSEPLYFIYNDSEDNFEPYFAHDKCIGGRYKYVTKPPINDPLFIQNYVNTIKAYTEIDYGSVLENNPSLSNEIRWINSKHPSKTFNLDYVAINQMKLNKFLQQSTIIKPALISITKDRMVLSVLNVSYFPIQVTGLNHKEKKQVVDLNPVKEIKSGKLDTITIDLPRSFENLFVSKKKKTTGFLLHKHIYDLRLTFKTLGSDKRQYASIIPYQEKEAVAEDLFRSNDEQQNHPDLILNKEKKIVTFKKDSVVIQEPLILPLGYSFEMRPGSTINILEGGKIISYSSFNLLGTKGRPIKIFSSDKKGQGILVLNAKDQSKLRYVTIDGLTNPKHGNWSVTGAVTFYESPVDLAHVSVSNNRCEDALNIVRTSFSMTRSSISNTQSDAFDGDFVTGDIIDCYFENLGNDAIDVSGSDITIKNTVVSYAGDKGLSAGEDSKMTVSDVEIANSEIGVAGKDLSIVDIKRITIKDTKLGFTAFKKKPEFGPSSINVINHELENVEMNYLIESSSSLIVNGEKIETTQNVKDRMYGVEFGVSSAETRNSQ